MLNLDLFAERLSDLMFNARLNPPALAEMLGLNRTTITRYLSGKKNPSLANVILLSDFFCCSSDFLLGLEQESSSKTFKKCPPFSEQLGFLLDHFGINKYQLQKWSKIPESAIYNWQRGQYTPTIYKCYKNCKSFGLFG